MNRSQGSAPRPVGVCPRREGGLGEGKSSCCFVRQPPGRVSGAQPVQAESRKQVDSAETQTGLGRAEAHVRAAGGAQQNEKGSLQSSQAVVSQALSWVSGCCGARQ